MTAPVQVRPTFWRNAVAIAIALQIAVHAWVVSQRWFYWDDFLIPARASGEPLFSSAVLFPEHDGHLAPAAFFIQVFLQRLMPAQWWPPALIMVLLSAVATLAFARAVIAVAGRRVPSLIIILCFTVSPGILPAKSWWTASLNILPWIIALSVSLVLVLRWYGLDRGGSDSVDSAASTESVWPVTISVVGTVVAALLFFEKALLIPPILLGVTLLVAHSDGRRMRDTVRRGWQLWLSLFGLAVAWFSLWFSLIAGDNHASGEPDWKLLWDGLFRGIGPMMLGGPWLWERWIPGQPFALAPVELSVLALVLAVGLLLIKDVRLPWLFASIYSFGALLLVVLGRRGEQVSGTIMLTLHYYADVAVVVMLCAAVTVRNTSRSINWDGIAAAVVLLSSIVSSISYGIEWQNKPEKTWTENAVAALAANQDRPLLNQFLPTEVLTPLLYPNNTTHKLFDSIARRPELSDVTTSPWLFDARGNAAEAAVLPVSHIPQGREQNCGTRIKAGRPEVIVLTSPLPLGMWTGEINTIAEADGHLEFSFISSLVDETERDVVSVPVGTEPKQSWAQVDGAGGWLYAKWVGPEGTSVCLGAGAIGPLAPVG